MVFKTFHVIKLMNKTIMWKWQNIMCLNLKKIKQAKQSLTHSCNLISHNNFILKTFLNY